MSDPDRPADTKLPAPEQSTPPRSLADSPWFWFLLFGLMALAALMVVGPKFATRQNRMQQNYEGRRDAWQRRVAPREETNAPPATTRPPEESP